MQQMEMACFFFENLNGGFPLVVHFPPLET